MSASGYPGFKFAKHLPSPLAKAEKDRAKLANWEKVKREVRKRDSGLCRVCGKPTSVPPHHLVFRSKGGRDTVENCILLCASDHRLAQSHVLEPSGLNANKPIVWRRIR